MEREPNLSALDECNLLGYGGDRKANIYYYSTLVIFWLTHSQGITRVVALPLVVVEASPSPVIKQDHSKVLR